MYASVARAAQNSATTQQPSHSKSQDVAHQKPESHRDDYYTPQSSSNEDHYVLTLVTNQHLHERVTALRQKYFPPKLNKIPGHLTLFHALPGSRLDKDVVPAIQKLADSTGAFDLHAGRPFKMSHGIGILVPKHQGGAKAAEVHDALREPWTKAGFLSPQDQRPARVHYTIMNKVDDEAQIEAAVKEIESTWEQPWGAATGLQLWNHRFVLASNLEIYLPNNHNNCNLRKQPWPFVTLATSSLADFVIAASVRSNGAHRSPDMTRASTPDQSASRRTLIHRASNKLLRTLSSQSTSKDETTLQEPVMDTRTPSPLPRTASGTDMTDYKPDLSQEVALLSTKLINAINYQTTLDDQLQQTKHELEMSQRQFEKLQAEKKYLDDMIRDGILVRRSDVDPIVASLRTELNAERIAREAAERSKKQTEAELENLTSALFEEANEMVAAARKDSEAAEKRNSQLKSKLSDTEVLLASQQEQLQDLKLTMERMSERGENDTARNSVPSTPIHPPSGLFDGLPINPGQLGTNDFSPEHPLFFSSLLVPGLRSDVAAYSDFQDLLQAARRAGHWRSSSSGTPAVQSGNPLGQLTGFAGSSPNLPGAFSFSNTTSPPPSQTFAPPLPALKDTKFYRRTLVEDIEPTLRLDLAPGLSFLSRRSVTSSLLQGSLVVEPFPAGGKFVGPIYNCALCGESRKSDQYGRKHRFRVSDEESAQRYPLCDYCLGRIRACGDFYTFLRMVRDGHWRADSEDEQKTAWEESVRLRERMFWARIGGGVVPSTSLRQPSPSTSAVKSPLQSINGEAEIKTDDLPSPQQEVPGPTSLNKRVSLEQKLVDVFQRHRKSLSIGSSLPDFNANGMMLQRTTSGTLSEKSAKADIEPIRESVEHSAVADSKSVANIVEHDSASTDKLGETVAQFEDKKPAQNVSIETQTAAAAATARTAPTTAEQQSRPPSLDSRRGSSSTVKSRSPERKQSAVLARVRAMEAKAEK